MAPACLDNVPLRKNRKLLVTVSNTLCSTESTTPPEKHTIVAVGSRARRLPCSPHLSPHNNHGRAFLHRDRFVRPAGTRTPTPLLVCILGGVRDSDRVTTDEWCIDGSAFPHGVRCSGNSSAGRVPSTDCSQSHVHLHDWQSAGSTSLHS